MTILNQATALSLGAQPVKAAYVGSTKVWPPVVGPISYYMDLCSAYSVGGTIPVGRTRTVEGTVSRDVYLTSIWIRFFTSVSAFTGKVVAYQVSNQARVGESLPQNLLPVEIGVANPYEIPLATPALLSAGVAYRVGVWVTGRVVAVATTTRPTPPIESQPPGVVWQQTPGSGLFSANSDIYPVTTAAGASGWDLSLRDP